MRPALPVPPPAHAAHACISSTVASAALRAAIPGPRPPRTPCCPPLPSPRHLPRPHRTCPYAGTYTRTRAHIHRHARTHARTRTRTHKHTESACLTKNAAVAIARLLLSSLPTLPSSHAPLPCPNGATPSSYICYVHHTIPNQPKQSPHTTKVSRRRVFQLQHAHRSVLPPFSLTPNQGPPLFQNTAQSLHRPNLLQQHATNLYLKAPPPPASPPTPTPTTQPAGPAADAQRRGALLPPLPPTQPQHPTRTPTP